MSEITKSHRLKGIFFIILSDMESVYNRIYKNFIKFRLTFAIKTI